MKKCKAILPVLLLLGIITACRRKGNPIVLPDTADINSIEINHGDTSAISIDPDYIEEFMELLSNMEITNQESIQDAPSVDDYVPIIFHCDDSSSEIYFYQKKDVCYVEQPYQGIYKPDSKLSEMITELLDSLDRSGASFTFQATVLEVNDTQLLVEPAAGSAELASADQIYVSTPEAATFQTGDIVEITYNGSIMETYPAQLGEVYGIQTVAQE